MERKYDRGYFPLHSMSLEVIRKNLARKYYVPQENCVSIKHVGEVLSYIGSREVGLTITDWDGVMNAHKIGVLDKLMEQSGKLVVDSGRISLNGFPAKLWDYLSQINPTRYFSLFPFITPQSITTLESELEKHQKGKSTALLRFSHNKILCPPPKDIVSEANKVIEMNQVGDKPLIIHIGSSAVVDGIFALKLLDVLSQKSYFDPSQYYFFCTNSPFYY